MAKLAIRGGDPLIQAALPTWPTWDSEEERLLLSVLRSGHWWRGAYEVRTRFAKPKVIQGLVSQFEHDFAEYLDVEHAVAVSSGTSALEIVLRALDIGEKDEVIVPSYSVISTASSILNIGATPIFVDVEQNNCNIMHTAIEERITPKTKALMIVHFGGVACEIEQLIKIAKKYNLFLIEDAAHALGSEWQGKKLGTLGTVAIFSFQNSKNISCGEGGMVVTNNSSLATVIKSLHDNGRSPDRPWYEHNLLGGNYRLTEFQAAIGIAQLRKLNKQQQLREKNITRFYSEIDSFPGINKIHIPPQMTACNYHLAVVKYNNNELEKLPRHRFLMALNAEGLPCISGYPAPLYASNAVRKTIDTSKYNCKNSNLWCTERAIWFHQSIFLTEYKYVKSYISVFEKVITNINEIRR